MAIETLQKEIRSSDSSISALPKSIKFLRAHYQKLKEFWETLENDIKTSLSDVLSVLGMFSGEEDELETLKFCLAGSLNVEHWGHEYIRHLSKEIMDEYSNRKTNDEESNVEDLMNLVHKIVPFNMSHNAEPAACDLLIEVEDLNSLASYVQKENYQRVCLYLLGNAKYAPEPEDAEIRRIALDIYKKFNNLPSAVVVALILDDHEEAMNILNNCEDRTLQRQLGFIIGQQRGFLNFNIEEEYEDDVLLEIVGNAKLSEYYKSLARDLNVEDPKAPEDIYKTHLIDSRHAGNLNATNAKQNLASSFVNSFLNAGFGTDTLMADEDSDWINQNKNDKRFSVAASLGLVYLWDEDGCGQLDRFLYSDDNHVKAGALLGIGVSQAGIYNESNLALNLITEELEEANDKSVQIGAILGFGIAYAGTGYEEVQEILLNYISEDDYDIEVIAMAALSLGLIYVGSGDAEISESLTTLLAFNLTDAQLGSKFTRFICLGLGLLFLGRQSLCEVSLELIKTMEGKPNSKYAYYTLLTCAYAGTGNVLKVQELLHACGEPLEEDEDGSHISVCVLGISLIAICEDLGVDMSIRMFDHLLHYGETDIKKAIPLALAMVSISNPTKINVVDTLSKLSHDSDLDVAQAAILGLGMVGAGTNNSRIAQLLRQLSAYYSKESDALFIVRIAQGLLHLGKGLLTIQPYHSHGNLLCKVSLAGILAVMHSCLDFGNLIHDKAHYLLYLFTPAIRPRFLFTVNEELEPLKTSVRVGQAVDTIGQAGKPKTITGFQTHDSPVLISAGHRAELGTDDYVAYSNYLEGCVILKKTEVDE
eukprot:TRINITY_DN5214_c4_g1_i1.p1 TRINITY_DN5214_c4_g1~~TRINITY_DN5214_c4_g1_i1.p1  ORF type:complete len:893 (+),score=370.90 TRINITY_DN5214_c4_g1_i1:224-2680(+)